MPAPMSAPTPVSLPIIPPFLEGLVRFLLPYFLPTCPDPDAARTEILETLSSYGARSRSEVINAARIIAYSYAAMETLAEARTPDLSPAMRLRHNSSANALNRSCLQNEKILEKRLAADLPGAAPAEAAPPEVAPIDDLADADFQAAIRRAAANLDARRVPPAISSTPNSPDTGHIPDHGSHWDQVTKDTYAALGISAKNIKAVEKCHATRRFVPPSRELTIAPHPPIPPGADTPSLLARDPDEPREDEHGDRPRSEAWS